jgi:hypothetical protein
MTMLSPWDQPAQPWPSLLQKPAHSLIDVGTALAEVHENPLEGSFH